MQDRANPVCGRAGPWKPVPAIDMPRKVREQCWGDCRRPQQMIAPRSAEHPARRPIDRPPRGKKHAGHEGSFLSARQLFEQSRRSLQSLLGVVPARPGQGPGVGPQTDAPRSGSYLLRGAALHSRGVRRPISSKTLRAGRSARSPMCRLLVRSA